MRHLLYRSAVVAVAVAIGVPPLLAAQVIPGAEADGRRGHSRVTLGKVAETRGMNSRRLTAAYRLARVWMLIPAAAPGSKVLLANREHGAFLATRRRLVIVMGVLCKCMRVRVKTWGIS